MGLMEKAGVRFWNESFPTFSIVKYYAVYTFSPSLFDALRVNCR